MFVITDGKRNDIGATMTAYAAAHLAPPPWKRRPSSPSARTPSPSTATWHRRHPALLEVCGKGDKGIFVLVKTSNPSSGELQDKPLADGNTVYRAMGAMCEAGGRSSPASTATPAWGLWWAPPIPPSWKSCGPPCPTPSSWCPATRPGRRCRDVAPGFDKNGLRYRQLLPGHHVRLAEGGVDGQEYAAAARREAIRMRDEIVGRIGQIKLP